MQIVIENLKKKGCREKKYNSCGECILPYTMEGKFCVTFLLIYLHSGTSVVLDEEPDIKVRVLLELELGLIRVIIFPPQFQPPIPYGKEFV